MVVDETTVEKFCTPHCRQTRKIEKASRETKRGSNERYLFDSQFQFTRWPCCYRSAYLSAAIESIDRSVGSVGHPRQV